MTSSSELINWVLGYGMVLGNAILFVSCLRLNLTVTARISLGSQSGKVMEGAYSWPVGQTT